MTTAHTQGRITFLEDGDANHYSMLTEGGRWWLSLLMNGEQPTARQIANLRRLAACWNACEGIPTETLEAVGNDFQFWPIHLEGSTRTGLIALLGIQNFTVQELKRQVESETRAKLKIQRDELLAALKLLDEAYCNVSPEMSREDRASGRQALINARAVIEKSTTSRAAPATTNDIPTN